MSFLLINSLIHKLLVRAFHERTIRTLILGFESQLALLVVEVFVSFSSLHFAPKEDTHDGTHRGTILDVLDNRVDFG